MESERKQLDPTLEVVLKVFTHEELKTLSRQQRGSLNVAIHNAENNNKEDGREMTVEQMQGIKDMVLNHMYHP